MAVARDATLTRPLIPSVPRALGAAFAAMLAVVMLLAGAAGSAAAATGSDSVVLAVEGAELLGPDPAPRDAEENPARELGGYEDREVPFTWGAAWLLTFLGLGGLATMGLVYWRAVERPGRAKAPTRR
jgi:hypothetical protein